MIRKIPVIRALVLALLAGLFSSVTAPVVQATTCAQYKIGYQGPLTGPEAGFGTAQLSGVQLALQKFLAANPSVTNISNTVKVIDDQGSPSVASSVITTALQDDCLLGVVGPAYSGAARVSLPSYEEKSLPIITPTAVRQGLGVYGPTVFNRSGILDFQNYTDMIADSVDANGNGKFAYIYERDNNIWNEILLNFEPKNVTITPIMLESSNLSGLSTELSNAKAAGATKVIVDVYSDKNLDTIASAAKGLGLDIIFGPVTWIEEIEAKLSNANLNGAYIYAYMTRFKYFDTPLKNENDSLGAPESFDAAYFLLNGIRSGANSRALLSSYIKTHTFSGITGELGFDRNGELAPRKNRKLQISNGQIVVANPTESKIKGNLSSTSKASLNDNFQFKVVNWDGQDVAYQAFVFNPSFNAQSKNELGTIQRYRLPNGVSLIEAYPSEDPQSVKGRRQIYEVSVASGAVTSVKNISVSPNTSVTLSGDTYLLALSKQNTVVTINTSLDIGDGTLIIGSGSNAIKAPTYWKKLSFTLNPTSTYDIAFYPGPEAWTLAPKTQLTNVALSGSPPYQITLTPALANVTAGIDPFPSTGGKAYLLTQVNGSFSQSELRFLSSTGKVGFTSPVGSRIKIRFVPNDNQLGEVTTPEYTVPSTGILEIPSVTFTGQNVVGTVSLSGGGTMTGGYFYVTDSVNPKNDWATEGTISPTGQFSFRASVGTYIVNVESRQHPEYKPLQITCVVTDVSQVKTCNGTAAVKKVVGNVSFSPNEISQNYSLGAYDITENGRYGLAFSSISSSGRFGFDLEAGEYLIAANRWFYDIDIIDDGINYDKGLTWLCPVGNSPSNCNLNFTSNFSYKIMDSSGSSLKGKANSSVTYRFRSSISNDDLKKSPRMVSRFQVNEIESLALPDGVSLVSVEKGHNYSNSLFKSVGSYLVTVSGGAVQSVQNMNTNAMLQPTNGVYDLTLPAPNFRAEVKDSVNPTTDSQVRVRSLATNQEENFYVSKSDPFFDFNLPAGSYQFDVETYQPSPSRATGRFTVTVGNDGLITMTRLGQTTNIAPVNGIFPLQFSIPNLTGTLTIGGAPRSASIYWFKLVDDKNYWNWHTWQNVPASGGIYANFLPGIYRPKIYLYDEELGQSVMLGRECVVPTTGSVTCNIAFPSSSIVTTISAGGSVLKQSDGVYASIAAKPTNPKDATFDNCCVSPDPTTGRFDFRFLDGTYLLTFQQEKSGSSNSRSYEVTIQNQQVTSFKDVGTGNAISPVNGVYALSFLPPNMSGSIKNAQGTNVDLSPKGGTIEVQKWTENQYWSGVRNYWISSTSYEFRIEGEGKYRLYVIPYDNSDYSATYSQEFYVNASNQVSTSATTGFSSSLTNFHVALNTNNLLFKVLNPIDDNPLSLGYIYFYKITAQDGRDYAGDVGIWQSKNGLVGKYLSPGNYEATLQVWGSNQIYPKTFTVEVTDTNTVQVKDAGVPVAKDGNRFVIKPFTTNVKGRILDPNGNVYGQRNNRWISVNLQKYDSVSKMWNYYRYGTNVDSDGYFGLRVDEEGKFRVLIEPYGNSTVAQTASEEFEITSSNRANFTKEFGSIKLNAPNFKFIVSQTETGTALSKVWILIQKDQDWKWANKGLNADSAGVFAGYLDQEGRYSFEIYPSSEIEGATRKTYFANVTKDSNGKFVVTFESAVGVAVTDSMTRLEVGGSNLRGVVYSKNGTTPLTDARVLPYEVTLKGETPRWDLASWTNANGKWFINLPTGTFKVKALPPYSSVSEGGSLRSGSIVIGSSGTVTSLPSGKSALDFSITLREPNWSGVLKAPTGDEVMRYSSICLNYRVSPQAFSGECVQSNYEGKFALSLPDDGTLDADSYITFHGGGKYPDLNLRGKTQIESVLGVSGSNITVRLPAPNILVTVTGGGVAQKDVYIDVYRPGIEYIGSQRTDSQGLAGVYSSNLIDAFQVNVWVPNQTSAINQNYVSTQKFYSAPVIASSTSNNVFSTTIDLPVPNLKGVIRTPTVGATASAIATGSYLSIYDPDRYEWISGGSVAPDGTFAFFLKGGCCDTKKYTMVVEPGYDKEGKKSSFVRKEYVVEVTTGNVATIKDKLTGASVGSETIQGVSLNTVFLGTPNLLGVVVDPSDTAVRSSEVNVWGKCDNWWSCYSYSDETGSFALSLSDGDYTIRARTPWGNSSLADSAQCQITVTSTSVTNKNGSCIQSDGKAKLQLRTPNFSFNLVDGSNPVSNAYVYMAIGGWSGYAYTDQNGKVSFLVDDQQASAGRPVGTVFDTYIYVGVWGSSSTLISWNCRAGDNKPVCNQLTQYTVGTPFGTKNLGNIQGATYNTRIKVTSPDASRPITYNAYAEIIRFDEGNNQWFGWGETNAEGYARYYLETSTALATAKFKVRVIPPYEYRGNFVEKIWDNNGAGYSLAQLNNLELSVGTPNLKLAVVSPSGLNPNRYGWYSLEVYDSTTATYKWDNDGKWSNGGGLDYYGNGALNLSASKQYRLTAYPGGGRSGSATTCIILTDTSTVISLVSNQCIGGSIASGTLTLALARGNVVGTVLAPDGVTKIVGAIVYANVVGATNEDKAVTTCTLSDGTYGMTLDPSFQWDIRVFPANKATGPQYANKLDNPAVTPQSNVTTTFNITLALKP